METAKVDIRKLQLLNDRINQCIDALNQVRFSVHGLSHSSPAQGIQGLPGMTPFAQGQPFGLGYQGFVPFTQAQPYLPGLAHSSGVFPTAPGMFAPGVLGVGPYAAFSPFGGLSHTSPEEALTRPSWSDPFVASRIAHTFPYVQYPVPPVVTIF